MRVAEGRAAANRSDRIDSTLGYWSSRCEPSSWKTGTSGRLIQACQLPSPWNTRRITSPALQPQERPSVRRRADADRHGCARAPMVARLSLVDRGRPALAVATPVEAPGAAGVL